MAKISPRAHQKGNIIAALIGGAITLIISVSYGCYYLGGVNQQLNNLSNRLNNIENSNRALSSGLTLTNNILIRVLNHVKISENEKIAIYDEITKTIRDLPGTLNISSSGKPTFDFGSPDRTNVLEPEYIKILKKWGEKINPPLEHSDGN